MNPKAIDNSREISLSHKIHWTRAAALLPQGYRYVLRQTWSSYGYDREAGAVAVRLSYGAEKALQEFSDGDPLAIFVLIMSGLYLLFHKFGNQDIIQINTPQLSLNDAEDNFSAQDVPLIVVIDEKASIKNLIHSVQGTISESYSLQEFPIPGFSEKFGSNVFAFAPDIHKRSERPAQGLVVKAVLSPYVQIEFSGRGGFSTDFFEALGRSLNAVLEGFANPDTLIKDLKWGEVTESRQSLSSETDKTKSGTIYGLFERQAAYSPDRVAIEDQMTQSTYHELSIKVDKLAFYLKDEYKIGGGDVIGVMMDRSEGLVTAMLAIMKAGAIYLPINPDDPVERISFILKDAGVKLLLIKMNAFSKVSRLASIPLIPVDNLLSSDLLDKYENFRCDLKGEDGAYIIYTSGSTGKPKGVEVCHQSFTYVMLAHIRLYGIIGNDRIPFFFNPSFDASLKHVFLSLFTGSTLLIPAKEQLDDPGLFMDFLIEKKATIANLSPAYLKLLDKRLLKGAVRMVITGGEAADVSDALFLSKSIDYLNAYGPTEASVCCTYYKVDPAISYGKCIPIGRPIDGTGMLILDEQNNLQPAGVIGQIGISGPGLARGYVNNPALTREKFINHPAAVGERVYLTGDLGILLPDGNIEYAGRKDNQVKINGYRVELDEIKQNLLVNALVTQAVVVKRDDISPGSAIVAYFVAENKVDTGQLRTYLKQSIPPYMLPQFFVQMDKLPLTRNGKIDERALPSPAIDTGGARTIVSPRNSMDEQIALIWSRVLGKCGIGIEDNFFDLGGNSIQVIKIYDELNISYPDCLKISELFDNPTISLQSDLLTRKTSIPANPGADYTVVSF